MILAVMYTVAGAYFLAMRLGWLHRTFVKGMARSQKQGLLALALGLLVLGLYSSWFQYFSRTPEGREHLERQRSLQQNPQGPGLPTGR